MKYYKFGFHIGKIQGLKQQKFLNKYLNNGN